LVDSQTETPSPAPTDAPEPSVASGAFPSHPLVAELLERIAAIEPPERIDALAAFAKAYTKRLSAEELDEMSVDELLAQARGAFGLADSRGTEPIAVRAFNPDPSTDGYSTAGSVIETNTDDAPFLVDSVTEGLAARSLNVQRLIHPVV